MKIRNILLAIMQRVFGSALLFFGMNKIFGLLPLPHYEGFARTFMEHLTQSGYIMPIIMLAQIVTGLCLFLNRYVALALIIVFPITLNIFLFHLFYAQATLIPAMVLMIWNTVLMLSRFRIYKTLLNENSRGTPELAANA